MGTRDGHVEGYGSPVPSPLATPGVTFPTTVVGQSATATETFTANSQVTINSVSASGPFTVGTPTPAVGTILAAGQTFSVPVTFTPTTTGSAGGALSLGTSAGAENYSLAGTAESASAYLVASPLSISFGGVEVGQNTTGTVVLSNEGAKSLTMNSITALNAPYSVVGDCPPRERRSPAGRVLPPPSPSPPPRSDSTTPRRASRVPVAARRPSLTGRAVRLR